MEILTNLHYFLHIVLNVRFICLFQIYLLYEKAFIYLLFCDTKLDIKNQFAKFIRPLFSYSFFDRLQYATKISIII